MLQNGSGLVGSDAFGHHVNDVVHHSRTELQVKVTLHSLLGDGLGHAFADTALELSSQQVAQPALQQRDDTAQEEEPNAPARCPEAAAGTLPDGASVEAVVDQVLQVLAHAHLSHQTVLVAVHTRQLTHVGKDVLQAVCKLEGIYIAQSELHVRVHHQLCEAHDLSAQVEGVAESRLLSLLRRQRLHWLQVEVVVQMQEVQVLSSDQEVQHVVTLAANLQTNLHPVQLCALEELRRGEDVHQVALVQRLGRAMVQLVENPDLQELLVGHAHLHRVVRGTVLLVPLPNKRNILCTSHVAAAKVEGPWCPVERDAVRCAVREERSVLKQRLASATSQIGRALFGLEASPNLSKGQSSGSWKLSISSSSSAD